MLDVAPALAMSRGSRKFMVKDNYDVIEQSMAARPLTVCRYTISWRINCV